MKNEKKKKRNERTETLSSPAIVWQMAASRCFPIQMAKSRTIRSRRRKDYTSVEYGIKLNKQKRFYFVFFFREDTHTERKSGGEMKKRNETSKKKWLVPQLHLVCVGIQPYRRFSAGRGSMKYTAHNCDGAFSDTFRLPVPVTLDCLLLIVSIALVFKWLMHEHARPRRLAPTLESTRTPDGECFYHCAVVLSSVDLRIIFTNICQNAKTLIANDSVNLECHSREYVWLWRRFSLRQIVACNWNGA